MICDGVTADRRGSDALKHRYRIDMKWGDG